MRYALRSVLFVRGPRPYALIVDDIEKDGAPHDWRWSINCAQGFGGPENRFIDARGNGIYSSLAMLPGATASDAVLYHSPIDDERTPGQAGLPRLLLRDVGLAAAAPQPAIVLQSRPPGRDDIPYLTYGYDNNRQEKIAVKIPSNRVLIERRQMVKPDYKVLLFPYRTGEPPPITTWNGNHTQLTIDLKNGTVDTLTFDGSNPDHRTRIRFNRGRK